MHQFCILHDFQKDNTLIMNAMEKKVVFDEQIAANALLLAQATPVEINSKIATIAPDAPLLAQTTTGETNANIEKSIEIVTSSDIEYPLSSQLAQMLLIGSPFRGTSIGMNDEKTEQRFATPNRSPSYDSHLQNLGWTASLEEPCLLQSPPNLDRLWNSNILSTQLECSPTLFHNTMHGIDGGNSTGQYMELDWARKTLINSFDCSIYDNGTRTPNSPSSSNIDPFNLCLPSQSLVTPPSLDQTFFLRSAFRVHSQRSNRAPFRSPIQRTHSHHASYQSETLSTVQSFPVSTRGGRGIRRSLISPLNNSSTLIGDSTKGLYFPSPPSSPINKEENGHRMKRLKLVYC